MLNRYIYLNKQTIIQILNWLEHKK